MDPATTDPSAALRQLADDVEAFGTLLAACPPQALTTVPQLAWPLLRLTELHSTAVDGVFFAAGSASAAPGAGHETLSALTRTADHTATALAALTRLVVNADSGETTRPDLLADALGTVQQQLSEAAADLTSTTERIAGPTPLAPVLSLHRGGAVTTDQPSPAARATAARLRTAVVSSPPAIAADAAPVAPVIPLHRRR